MKKISLRKAHVMQNLDFERLRIGVSSGGRDYLDLFLKQLIRRQSPISLYLEEIKRYLQKNEQDDGWSDLEKILSCERRLCVGSWTPSRPFFHHHEKIGGAHCGSCSRSPNSKGIGPTKYVSYDKGGVFGAIFTCEVCRNGLPKGARLVSWDLAAWSGPRILQTLEGTKIVPHTRVLVQNVDTGRKSQINTKFIPSTYKVSKDFGGWPW